MSIAENIKVIQHKIAAAADLAGRDLSEIKLVAVSKTKPVSMIEQALDFGMLDFGENRPQELAAKFEELKNQDIRWHQIGTLQKNKVRHIIGKAYLIHSTDNLSLAAEIDKRAAAVGKIQNILVQVNVSGEDTKSGVSVGELTELCKRINELENVAVKGLMTISVRGYTYEQNKSLFGTLKNLSDKVAALGLERVQMQELSMGMTNDFEAAIEAGATIIRVGTAIFGERDYSALNL